MPHPITEADYQMSHMQIQDVAPNLQAQDMRPVSLMQNRVVAQNLQAQNMRVVNLMQNRGLAQNLQIQAVGANIQAQPELLLLDVERAKRIQRSLSLDIAFFCKEIKQWGEKVTKENDKIIALSSAAFTVQIGSTALIILAACGLYNLGPLANKSDNFNRTLTLGALAAQTFIHSINMWSELKKRRFSED